MKVLIVEDQQRLAQLLKQGLAERSYTVACARTCREARDALCETAYDLIILDLGLPDGDGLDLLREWRKNGFKEPVLILSARDAVQDRVKGLDLGADDYLSKPFSFEELLARVHALLRRRQAPSGEVLRFADLELDVDAREARRGGRTIELTTTEFNLLILFLRHPRKVLTRDVIMEHVWAYDFEGESNVLEVYVRYLRSKLEANGDPRLIHTIRGAGYVLKE